MGRWVCKTKCFHRGTIWEPGETLVPRPGENLDHFVPEEGYEKPLELSPEPTTFSGINEALKKEEEDLFKGRIHEDKPKPPRSAKSRGGRPKGKRS